VSSGPHPLPQRGLGIFFQIFRSACSIFPPKIGQTSVFLGPRASRERVRLLFFPPSIEGVGHAFPFYVHLVVFFFPFDYRCRCFLIFTVVSVFLGLVFGRSPPFFVWVLFSLCCFRFLRSSALFFFLLYARPNSLLFSETRRSPCAFSLSSQAFVVLLWQVDGFQSRLYVPVFSVEAAFDWQLLLSRSPVLLGFACVPLTVWPPFSFPEIPVLRWYKAFFS